MKERPIIFDAESIRAILAGTKTQTRRVVKPKPEHIEWFEHQSGWCARLRDTPPQYEMVRCPYGVPGDRLWVRETWGEVDYINGHNDPSDAPYCRTVFDDRGNAHNIVCRADVPGFEWDEESDERWRSPIHMPRWASRITLEVVSVRVQRVQEISEDDAQAEGVAHGNVAGVDVDIDGDVWNGAYRRAFSRRWDAINAKRGYPWSSNPWVWVVGFRRAGEIT